MDHPFRSAMFGGFNRQDVLEYLENSAQQAAQQQQELQDICHREMERWLKERKRKK